ncbi:class I SAM-dependent methyltransferase [Nocardia inohanensis]|uniref:class I SAM-dependent methyltransferase n=1 Tax=Nocardia inohanensis TaxID=209246 RepID=UPI00082BD8DA|nr:class I SAM-dependent methyltransferase [Nocardia inohanensis]
MTRPTEFWDSAYDDGTAPWVIGEPQPAVVELEAAGWVRGTVLDIGCGTGEHAIFLAERGYEVCGLDVSPSAIRQARENAERHGVTARFEVADALNLDPGLSFDTIIDVGLFHVFASTHGDVAGYVRNLRTACALGGRIYILAFSDAEPGFGPRIPRAAIEDAFGTGWLLEDLRPTRCRARIPADFTDPMGRPEGTPTDESAWLARVRRTDS